MFSTLNPPTIFAWVLTIRKVTSLRMLYNRSPHCCTVRQTDISSFIFSGPGLFCGVGIIHLDTLMIPQNPPSDNGGFLQFCFRVFRQFCQQPVTFHCRYPYVTVGRGHDPALQQAVCYPAFPTTRNLFISTDTPPRIPPGCSRSRQPWHPPGRWHRQRQQSHSRSAWPAGADRCLPSGC